MDLSEGVLRKTAGPIRLEGSSEIALVSARFAEQALQALRIFSHDLDPSIYDRAEFLDSVRRLALSNTRAPVQILLFDAEPAVRNGHRLIELTRQLSSRIQIRSVPEEFHHQIEAYLLADDSGYLLRRVADVLEGTADFFAPQQVRRMRDRFEHIWERSEEPLELRTFGRGL